MLSKILTRNLASKPLFTSQYKIIRSFSNFKAEKPESTQQSTSKEVEKPRIDPNQDFPVTPEYRELRDNFMRELQIQKEKSRTKNPSTQELRDSILFEEVLRKEVDIPLYDAGNSMFRLYYLGNMFLVVFGIACFFYFYYAPHIKDSKKWIYTVPCVLFCIARIKHYHNFQQFFVQSIKYNTQDKNFTMLKRKFLFGTKKEVKVPKNELLYTEDEILNRKRVNYINMRNLDLYSIGFKNAWKNKELFSHLISQRIK